jgi:hypothetical protein
MVNVWPRARYGLGCERFEQLKMKLSVADEIHDVHPNVLGDLPQKKRRNVSGMKWNRRAAAIGMTKLFVGTALTDFDEAEGFEDAGNFTRFENRNVSPKKSNRDCLCADEFRFQLRLAVFEQHGDDFFQIQVQLLQRRAL